MTIDKEKLKDLAEAVQAADAAYLNDECNHVLHEALIDADDRFMEAATPDVVLALLAEIEALHESANFRAVQSLRADCEALRKDAERFRYIERDADSGMSRIYGNDWISVIDDALAQEVQP